MLPTKFLFIWQSGFRGEVFRNRSIRNNNCLWQPYLLMDRDEISNLYRGPPIDTSYQVSVHLAKRFQRRRCFRNHPIRNKNCLWWPYLLTDRDEMRNHNRELSIDAVGLRCRIPLRNLSQLNARFAVGNCSWYIYKAPLPSPLQKNYKYRS